MSSDILHGGRFSDAQKSFFSVRNIQIWIVLSSIEVDLLIFMNRVLRLRNVQKWAVPSRKWAVLLILSNLVLWLRIVHI